MRREWAPKRGSLVRLHLRWCFRNFGEIKGLWMSWKPEIRGHRSTSGFEEFAPQWFELYGQSELPLLERARIDGTTLVRTLVLLRLVDLKKIKNLFRKFVTTFKNGFLFSSTKTSLIFFFFFNTFFLIIFNYFKGAILKNNFININIYITHKIIFKKN